MSASRRETRIKNGRDRHVEPRFIGNLAVLRMIEGPLEIIEIRSNVYPSGKRLAGSVRCGFSRTLRQTCERRQCSESEVDFRERPIRAVVQNLGAKIGRDIDGI